MNALTGIKMDWYDNIEAPIRPLVKLLRDNGFNTYCSCGHEMKVDCDLTLDGEMKRLHDLLAHNGHRNYTIILYHEVVKGVPLITSIAVVLKGDQF